VFRLELKELLMDEKVDEKSYMAENTISFSNRLLPVPSL
jgi:hypothetical protein